MNKLYISSFTNPYINVAIERYLLLNAKDDFIIYLWVNEPCTIIGRNQNVFNEVNIDYAKNNNIHIVRRFSGGGAVYQDLGNICYTFIGKDEVDENKLNNILIDVFKNIGININFSGRNDILVNDRKFSGIAYCEELDHFMYHGTCLVNCDLNKLVDVLKPHDYKLKTHSISSYKSRVINLNEIYDITIDDIKNAFTYYFKDKGYEIIDKITINNEIQEIINNLKSDEWIYNDCPSFDYSFDIKLNNSNYHFNLNFKNGIIEKVDVFTDDLNVNQLDYYKKILLNKKINFLEVEAYLKNL